MRFKHAFHVFVDNFSTTYKILLYKILVGVITAALSCAVIIPTLNNILSTSQYAELQRTAQQLWSDIIALNMESLSTELSELKSAIGSFGKLLSEKAGLVAAAGVCLALVMIIGRFLAGIGQYVTGALVNDKMALHANSPFIGTLVKNLKHACLYSVIYAPVTFLYDVIGGVIIWAIVFLALRFVKMALIKIFLVMLLAILLVCVRTTFASDWLPALVHSKMNNRKAIAYALPRRGKKTGGAFSTMLVLILTIFALNFAAGLFTFGAGLLITLPASTLILICFRFVNYFDGNKLKYFVDEYTVIGPNKESPVTKEEFFRGDDQN